MLPHGTSQSREPGHNAVLDLCWSSARVFPVGRRRAACVDSEAQGGGRLWIADVRIADVQRKVGQVELVVWELRVLGSVSSLDALCTFT